MHILAHRGVWKLTEDKNTRQAFIHAFTAGFGAETDIRDLNGELVISHDMPRQGALPLTVVLDDYAMAGQPGYLALNIKADGLTESVNQLLKSYGITNYFCFDMSVPDTLAYLHAGLVTAARLSEYEPEGLLSELAQVLWIDGFYDLCVSSTSLQGWLSNGKSVCLVSPELHGRHPVAMFQQLAALPDTIRRHPALMLCTDLPVEAREILE